VGQVSGDETRDGVALTNLDAPLFDGTGDHAEMIGLFTL
jgi:hypothetical protein